MSIYYNRNNGDFESLNSENNSRSCHWFKSISDINQWIEDHLDYTFA